MEFKAVFVGGPILGNKDLKFQDHGIFLPHSRNSRKNCEIHGPGNTYKSPIPRPLQDFVKNFRIPDFFFNFPDPGRLLPHSLNYWDPSPTSLVGGRGRKFQKMQVKG